MQRSVSCKMLKGVRNFSSSTCGDSERSEGASLLKERSHSSPPVRGHSELSAGRLECLVFFVHKCRDSFALIVFLSQNETQILISPESMSV